MNTLERSEARMEMSGEVIRVIQMRDDEGLNQSCSNEEEKRRGDEFQRYIRGRKDRS